MQAAGLDRQSTAVAQRSDAGEHEEITAHTVLLLSHETALTTAGQQHSPSACTIAAAITYLASAAHRSTEVQCLICTQLSMYSMHAWQQLPCLI
jgi:hypothetical protein